MVRVRHCSRSSWQRSGLWRHGWYSTGQTHQGRILYADSDSGAANESILQLYLDQMGLLEENRRSSWSVLTSNQQMKGWVAVELQHSQPDLLKQTLAEQDYDLVIIDSLKAVTANTRYSIERNIGDIMRLMQNIVLSLNLDMGSPRQQIHVSVPPSRWMY